MKKLLLPVALLFALATLGRAAALPIGAAAPVVSGTTEAGATLNFADVYKANKYTLVYFYPKAFTSGCTRQGQALTQGYPDLTKAGVTVIGVSKDTVDLQKSFKDQYKFPFTLIADTDGTVMKAFGQSGLSLASREAYLIKDNKIVYHDVGVTTKQAENVLNFVSRDNGGPTNAPNTPAAPAAPATPSSPSTTAPAAK